MKCNIRKHLLKAKIILLGIFGFAFQLSANDNSYQLPLFVDGIKNPVLSLDGSWQFRFTPGGKWNKVQVPGELAMQGYAIEHDKPYTYQKSVTIPADYSGKQVILRFDGVYSQARLSVNGTFIREHKGGFTRWETDITAHIKTGKKNDIKVEITDRLNDISYASGYAHHPIGGILRSVTLFALPRPHLYDFHVATHLDSLYQDAVLELSYATDTDETIEVKYSLHDAQGAKTPLPQDIFSISHKGPYTNSITVKQPMKWDAEHPNLYLLHVSLQQKGKEISRFTCQVGFREVKIVGNRMLVNGSPVKLRGACRHDIHPTLGRSSSADMDSLDALLFKESNMNFVRTSHYPPTEKFLEYCDRYGIYVECETAVCFVDTYRQKNYAPGNTQNDTEHTAQYLSQCREMVKAYRSHPSILFWSIGNESVYGSNFQQCWDWMKATDLTRPVIFSYPGSEKEKNKVYDILSMHYPYVDGNLTQWGMTTHRFQGHGIPALFDEWAHPACYTYQTLQTDPNIREFWGMSMDMMWRTLFDSPGGLGGNIWGYVDELFMLPVPKEGKPYWKEFAKTAKPENYQGNCVGYGEWGIVDIWRRKKPEFWSTKKAHSPIKILLNQLPEHPAGQRLIIPVYNRFDHTRLDEVKAYYTYKGIRKEMKMPTLEPHKKGVLVVAGENWESGDNVRLEFFTKDNLLIDACLISLGQEQINLPKPAYKGSLNVEETSEQIIVKGNGFEIPFCKTTGLICNAKSDKQVVIEHGPFLNMDVNLNHLTGAEVRNSANKFTTTDADWKKTGFTIEETKNQVLVKITGSYNHVRVDLQIQISPEGKLEFDYITTGEPNGYLRETGLKFYLPDALDHLQWKRKGYWSYYPENEFAGNEGAAAFYNNQQAAYGQKPQNVWHMDTHNYFYWADNGAGSKKPLTQAAKGMKENTYFYTLSAGSRKTISVVSEDASLACRTNRLPNEQLILYVNNRWDYPEIAWGNYCKTLENTPCYGKITVNLL